MGDSKVTQPSWKEVAARKQKQRESRIRPEWKIDSTQYAGRRNLITVPLECGILSDKELYITSQHDAVDIVEKIRDNVFTVEEVVTAFCKRAAIAQQTTNCLTEIMFDEAIEHAKQMDLERSQNPSKPLPPLFGLPISLKDGYKVPGFDATIGFIALADKPSEVYSVLPLVLKNLGAVFHCKTNCPQTLWSADCDNNVFGRTLNPHNTSLTAGGSTGGESTLLAMGGTVLGMGTDVGGSLRIPAACGGVYGFKPSASIIPFAGQQSPATPGIIGIVPSAGPMATTPRACAMFMKAVMQAEPWRLDAGSLHLPWMNWQPKSEQPFRIGYIEDYGFLTPTPPMRRALAGAMEKLRRAGHELVPIKLDNFSEAVDTAWELIGVDGMQTCVDFMAAAGEPKVPSVELLGLLGKPAKTLNEVMKLNFKRMMDRARYNRMWSQYNVDFLLTLPAPHTTLPHDRWSAVGFTLFYSYVDWPGAVIPVGTVDESDVPDSAAKYGKRDEEIYKLYTGPKDYENAPISIQLIGQSQEDEKLAYYTTVVDRILHRA